MFHKNINYIYIYIRLTDRKEWKINKKFNISIERIFLHSSIVLW